MPLEVIYENGQIVETINHTDQPSVLRWDEFDFRKRFTRDERKAIMAATQADADLADFEAMLQAAGRTGTQIVSIDALLIDAMDALVDGGLLTQERRDAIMGVVA